MSDKPVEYGGTQYGGTEYGSVSYSLQEPQQQPQQDNNPFSDNNYPSYPPPPQYQEPNPPASSPTYVSPTAPLPPPQQYPAPTAPQYPPQPAPYQPAHPPYPAAGHPLGYPPTETTVLYLGSGGGSGLVNGGVLSGALVVESNPDTPRTLTELYPLLPLDYPGGWLAAVVTPEEHRDWGEKVNQEIEKQEDEYRAHLRTRRWLVWWFISTILACVILFYVLGNDELSFFIIFLIVLTEFASIGLIIWYSRYKLNKMKSNVVEFANDSAEQRFQERGAVYDFECIDRGSWLMDWRLTITAAS
mmetsp:Transcript_27151/g.42251  ORF Transcript_27151/g.42251 Transcript_27151/m.42251 type:complete len:301 (-) Transcript_27151:102-1004(-)|eukprot:CAMPEP_0201531932 /NCGR_PEP_ID=MMETSP0161_2-20130828/49010_1 /ASSEMBLY_ACC=CAM_ASM_000251 /TAXON_ID=180227 /ORGANISM="Neoparamoeba aestuarina, Strain SoJaBio B1-5/56/2" /LENGTH=300 /DNA_ID=CAMNT_0047935093 /DNA_START=634 /DNA_END=1536 /DNA_ORIENTATION=+